MHTSAFLGAILGREARGGLANGVNGAHPLPSPPTPTPVSAAARGRGTAAAAADDVAAAEEFAGIAGGMRAIRADAAAASEAAIAAALEASL